MTTIAYRDGIMASDSRTVRGETISAGGITKMFRVRDGVAAITGDMGEGMVLLAWLQNPPIGAQPKVNGDKVSVIHISADGQCEVHEGAGLIRPIFDFMAWGSGSPIALGALYAGASAAEAVQIASLVDPWTGGEIMTMKVRGD